jgi:hypothetical protein
MQKIMRLVSVFVCAVLLCAGCGADIDKALDDTQASIDAGDYTKAINSAQSGLAIDTTNFRLTLLLSAAYSGRAGINFFELSKRLTDSANESSIFAKVHSSFVATIGSSGLADLRLAISTLTGFTGTVDSITDFRYQLGLLQTMEAFALSTIAAKTTSTATLTVTDITATQKSNTQSDFLDADNNLILGGLAADNQLVAVIRKNYCALKERSTGSGFTLAELQDQVNCQLAADPTAITFQSSSVTICTDFSGALTGSCSSAGDTQL